MKIHLRKFKIQLLEYFPIDNDVSRIDWFLIHLMKKLPVGIHNQPLELIN